MGDLYRLAGRLELLALEGMANPDDPHAARIDVLVMDDVSAHPGSTITAISGRLGSAQSHVSSAVARMVGAGWLVSQQDPQDGRRTLVEVSEPATTAITARSDRDAHTLLRRRLVEIAPDFDLQEAEALVTAVQRLAELLVRAEDAPSAADARLGGRPSGSKSR